MRRRIFVPCLVIGFLAASLPARDSQAQRLLKRLRDRLGPVIEQLQEQPTQNLPARPYPSTNPDDEGSSAADRLPTPAAPYQLPARPLNGNSPSVSSPNTAQRSGNPPSGAGMGAELGIRAVAANPGYPAVQILAVRPDTAAAAAGLRRGDFIFAIDGTPTGSVETLANEVARRRIGEEAILRVGRAGQVSDITVRFPPAAVRPPSANSNLPAPATGERETGEEPKVAVPAKQAAASQNPELKEANILGAELVAPKAKRGILVKTVQPNSPADRAGLNAGDRLISIDGKMIGDLRRFVEQLRTPSADGDPPAVRLIRKNQLVDVTLFTATGSTTNGPTGTNSSDAEKNQTSANAGEQTRAAEASPNGKGSSGKGSSGKGSGGQSDSGSLLGGFGSVLGGVFSPSANPIENKSSPQRDNGERETNRQIPQAGEILPAPRSADPLALEPPPSSGSRDQRAVKKDKQQSDDKSTLREEAERLRKRLKELESQLQGDL
jgi:membrane-associated protease RseP (regulator of RpoE activity)